MDSTFRHLRFLNLIFSFDIDIKLLFPLDKKNLICKENQVLDSIVNSFLNQNKIPLKKKYFLYLKRNNQIIRKLNKQKKIYDLKLRECDEIIISGEEKKVNEEKSRNGVQEINQKAQEKISIETKEELIKTDPKPKNKLIIIDDDKKLSSKINIIKDEKKNNLKKSKKYKIIMILIGSLIGILLFGMLTLLIIKYIGNKLKKKISAYKKEELIIKKNYPVDLLLKFESLKATEIQIEGENNSKLYINETFDFIFIVRQKMIEKDRQNLIEKEHFIGYIAILNHTMINETDNIVTVYDKKLNEYLNSNKLINEKSQDLKFIGNNGNLCFAKIEFYLNGEIQNYSIPKDFSEENFVFIDDISQLIIPQISSKLYSKNIDEKMEEILSFNNETTNRRLSKKKHKKYEKYKIPFNSKVFERRSNKQVRRMEEMNYTEINYTDDILVEEYLVEPLSDSINITLREANEGKNNEDKNISQLTQYSLKNIENEKVKLEGSLTNISIFSIIDEKGILESVEKKTISTMLTPDNIDEEDDEEIINLNNQIYDNNNLISSDDMEPSENEKEFNNNNKIIFNISSISIFNTMIINRTDYFQNETLNNQLYEYFDGFKYELYFKKNESINEINNEDEVEKRDLSEEESYYGLKKIAYAKDLYKYNLLGIKMQKQILNEINPRKGTTSTYFVMTFGNVNFKVKVADQQTNLHITLEQKNKMAYNLILLLNQSNIDLIERNKNYLEVIINLENNISNLLLNYDYSELFKDSLNNLSAQISNFSRDIFDELILLIDRVYENYTYILNSIINDDYDLINQIIMITREEYIKYIYNMINLIEIFENDTINFFKELEQEIKILDYFQIDILYDIIDVIHDANLIFNKFNKYLFKSIEKGIYSN